MDFTGRRIAILAHDRFPEGAKTAVGVMRYGDYDVVAVVDRETAGTRVGEHLSDAPDAPIVERVADVDADVDGLLIGVSPIGGGFDESWRDDVRTAIERGWDVVSGLHYFLADDEEFAALAADRGVDLHDVRRPPDDLTVSGGRAADVDADVVVTVGTDCSVGKMTATCELVAAAREAGVDAGFVPTGQTGIVVEGWGIPIDRTISDFAAGAVEEMVLERGDDHDVLFVEGQGSIVHPAYSPVTIAILHGAMPDAMVLCHEVDRERVHGYESFELPPPSAFVDRYEALAEPVRRAEVAAGMLNTRTVEGDAAAREAVDGYAEALGVPATDPVRFDAAEVLDALP